MSIPVTEAKKKGTRSDDAALGFGQVFTDHMFVGQQRTVR